MVMFLRVLYAATATTPKAAVHITDYFS